MMRTKPANARDRDVSFHAGIGKIRMSRAVFAGKPFISGFAFPVRLAEIEVIVCMLFPLDNRCDSSASAGTQSDPGHHVCTLQQRAHFIRTVTHIFIRLPAPCCLIGASGERGAYFRIACAADIPRCLMQSLSPVW